MITYSKLTMERARDSNCGVSFVLIYFTVYHGLEKKGENNMGKFLIFIGVTLLLIVIGLGVWWLGNLIYIKVQRENEKFEVEKEGYEIAKDQIKNKTNRKEEKEL